MSEPQLRLESSEPRFADAVFADIDRIRRTGAGRQLFRRLLAAGCSVTIGKPRPPTSPPNAWTRLANPESGGGDAVIAYDPADWPPNAKLGVLPSDVMLFGRLLDALSMATGTEIPEASGAVLPAELEAYVRERAAPPAAAARGEP